jgi:hypothetical protein
LVLRVERSPRRLKCEPKLIQLRTAPVRGREVLDAVEWTWVWKPAMAPQTTSGVDPGWAMMEIAKSGAKSLVELSWGDVICGGWAGSKRRSKASDAEVVRVRTRDGLVPSTPGFFGFHRGTMDTSIEEHGSHGITPLHSSKCNVSPGITRSLPSKHAVAFPRFPC